MKYSKKKINNAEQNLLLFLKVLGYLNEEGELTNLSLGMLMIEEGELLIIKPKGKKRLQRLINKNFGLLSFISTTPKIKEMSVREIRNNFAIKNISK